MHRLERVIYDRVKQNPVLKNLIVDVYQRLFWLLPVKELECNYRIHPRKGYFFGFHDKCPWSADGTMLLAHRIPDIPLRMPEPEDRAGIGYFAGDDFAKFHPLASTRAWNWQKGAMLQWVGSSSDIIFNDYDGKKNVAKRITTEGETVATIPRPVAAVNPDGTTALSYGFERVRRGAPAYGYANGVDPEEHITIAKDDGLYAIDLDSLKISRLFSIMDVSKIEPEPSMKKAYHYFSHCLFAPAGERFVFFHRWVLPKGLQLTRMISADMKGKELFVFPSSGMISHICWRDDEHILAYGRTKRYGDKYHLFRDRTGHFSIIGNGQLTSDGHPQYSPDRRWILTDTYPDRLRRQSLLMYDTGSNRCHSILRQRIPLRYRYDIRCDFHPRWNREGGSICFDAPNGGTRSLCTIALDPDTVPERALMSQDGGGGE
jgi:hypothetical protein